MATATVTTTITNQNVWDDGQRIHAVGTIAISASPATYQNLANGGMVLNFTATGLPVQQTAQFVEIYGIAGFIYPYVPGTTAANGYFGIFESAGSAAALAELSNGASIPAGVSGDTIRFHAIFRKW